MNSGLRPNLSAAQPPSGEPIKMPNSADAAIRPSQSSEMSSSSVDRADHRPDDPEDVAVEEHPADQDGDQPGS